MFFWGLYLPTINNSKFHVALPTAYPNITTKQYVLQRCSHFTAFNNRISINSIGTTKHPRFQQNHPYSTIFWPYKTDCTSMWTFVVGQVYNVQLREIVWAIASQMVGSSFYPTWKLCRFFPILLNKMHLKTSFKALKRKNSLRWSFHFIKGQNSFKFFSSLIKRKVTLFRASRWIFL